MSEDKDDEIGVEVTETVVIFIVSRDGKRFSINQKAAFISGKIERGIFNGELLDGEFQIDLPSDILKNGIDYMKVRSGCSSMTAAQAAEWEKKFFQKDRPSLFVLLECATFLEIEEMANLVKEKLIPPTLPSSSSWNSSSAATVCAIVVVGIGVASYFGGGRLKEAALATFSRIDNTINDLPNTGRKAEGIAREIGREVGEEISTGIKDSVSSLTPTLEKAVGTIQKLGNSAISTVGNLGTGGLLLYAVIWTAKLALRK